MFSGADEDMSSVTYPVIVKPKMEAVSFGLRVVHEPEELKEAVAFIVEEFQQQALVEQFIPGREFAVGLLGNNPVEAFPVLEIQLETPEDIQTVEDNACGQPLAHFRQQPLVIELGTVERTVNQVLHPPPQWIKCQDDAQGGQKDYQRIVPPLPHHFDHQGQ